MLQEIIIMKDMVQELYKDRKDNTILQEQLMAMKEEKQGSQSKIPRKP